LGKSILVDASTLKYKPSVLASVMVYLGFQLQFEVLLKHKHDLQMSEIGAQVMPLDLNNRRSHEFVVQVASTYCIWVDTLTNML